MRKTKKPKIGQILRIVLLDHADKGHEDIEMSGPGPLVFETFGRLAYESKDAYELAYWGHPKGEVDTNADYTTVVKGAIVSIEVLK